MASNAGSEFNRFSVADRESRLLNPPADVNVEPQRRNQSARKKVCTVLPFRTAMERVLAVLALVLLVICVIVIALLAVEKRKEVTSKEEIETAKFCSFSKEAQRVGLDEFLSRVQKMFYEYNRASLEWRPGMTLKDLVIDMKTRYRPMNYTPEYLKERTDIAMSLYNEIQDMDVDENQLKPREAKSIYQVKQLLKTTFGSAYDANFYSGDWLLGPNHFCWQSICDMPADLNVYAHYATPDNLEELEGVINTIFLHGEAIKQYRLNMYNGVKAGMVRSVYSCKSALDAFKIRFKKTTKENKPEDILKEWFLEAFRKKSYFKGLSEEDQEKWLEKKGMRVSDSIDKALVEGIGKPLVEFVEYFEHKHIQHCLPKDVSSGLAGIPVDHIYLHGRPTIMSTTKTLPLTGQRLSGKENYKKILHYFTTSDITPEEIYQVGEKILHELYPQAIAIARNFIGSSLNDTEEAVVREFKKILNSSEQYFNDEPFPTNESDVTAYKNCSDSDSAKLHCPKRWAAMMKWADYGRETLGMLAPKLIPMFYHTGDRITIPNCPVELSPSFNPSSAAQSFRRSTKECEEPAYIKIPFFLNNFGPKFTDWSVMAHEGWPGHHTQSQGMQEYFTEQCQDVLKWLDGKSVYTFFSEGWALYAENPLIAKDTNTYEGEPLKKYGMLKWQIWRALRLIVDTGLHYRGMNRTAALELFSKYAWDDSDVSEKEVTRYMGAPGQATAYTLGQQKIIKMRDYCEKELEEKFDLREFHFQILSTGSAPEAYLDKHIRKYVKCVVSEDSDEDLDETLDEDLCYYIIYPHLQRNLADIWKKHHIRRRAYPHYFL